MNTKRQARGTIKAGAQIGGQFAALQRGAAPAPDVDQVTDPLADLRAAYWDAGKERVTELPSVYSPGDFAFDPEATEMRVYRDVAGKSIAALTVQVNPSHTGALTADQLERGRPLIADVLQQRYGASQVSIDEGVLTFELTADLHGAEDVSPDMAADVLGEHTEFYKFHRETDQQVFGKDYLYADLAVSIDDGYFPDEKQVEAVKAVCAQAIDGRPDAENFPQLTLLRDRGYCTNAYDALSEAQRIEGRVRDHKLHLFRVTLSAELLAQDIRFQGTLLDDRLG